MARYFLFAGEASADLHGSSLLQALAKQDQEAIFSGVGGPQMRQTSQIAHSPFAFECFLPMEEFQVMGFSDVLFALPRLYRLFHQVCQHILARQPDCVILIDYPGFNLRLARALRKQGFKGKLVQYICPTVWAHGKKRIEILANNYDLLLTIFPFEAAYFAHTSLPVHYIGNPLVERIHAYAYQPDWREKLGISNPHSLIALFPGSRPGEIKRHLPRQLQAAALLLERYPSLSFAVSCGQLSFEKEIRALIQKSPLSFHSVSIVPPQYTYDLMKNCQSALAKSGTVTLELALHHVPTVVHYEMSSFNYAIAKYVLRLNLPNYCLANILSQQRLFPEWIGKKTPPLKLAQELESLQFDPHRRIEIISSCRQLEKGLASFSSSSALTAAKTIRIGCYSNVEPAD